GAPPVSVALDATHDPALRSWVDAANDPHSDFPIQNLPFGVFRRRGSREAARIGVAIGDRIVDLAACANAGLLAGDADPHADLAHDDALNRLMARGRGAAQALLVALVDILRAGN